MESEPDINPRLQRDPIDASILIRQIAAAGCGIISLETALRSGLPAALAIPFGLVGATSLALVFAYRLSVGWSDRVGRVAALAALAGGAWLVVAHEVKMAAMQVILAAVWLAQTSRRDEDTRPDNEESTHG